MEGIEAGGAAQTHHAEVAAVAAVEVTAGAVADGLQTETKRPPQRQMQHQQEALEALHGHHLALFQGEATPFGILVGGLGRGPAAVFVDPRGPSRTIREEDPGLLGGGVPADGQRSPGAIPPP